MTGFVDGDGATLLLGRNLILLLQTADNAIHGIQEILLAHLLLAVTGSNQGGLVADVGDISAREARRLAGQQIDIHRLVNLDGAQVDAKHLLTLIQIGQIHVNLAVKASGTQQGLIQHIHTVGGGQDNDTAV